MTDQVANELREIANEIVTMLFVSQKRKQLESVRDHVNWAIQEHDKAAMTNRGEKP